MTILPTLRQNGGINALAVHCGLQPAAMMAAANALIPGLVESFREYSGGMAGLLQTIEANGGAALAQSIMSEGQVDIQPGNQILVTVGYHGVSPEADPAASMVDPELRQRLTPMLAMLLGGYLSARSASGGLTEQELGALLDERKSFYSSGDEPV